MSKEITITNTKENPFEITSFDQAERFSKLIAESDFAPKDYKGKPGNVLIAMQMGYELGLKPMQAIQNIAVVNGRPMVWGDAALALVRNHPECRGVNEKTEGNFKDGNAVAICTIQRSGELIEGRFSYAQAKQAGLIGKTGPWSQYPERMLQMRARGFALRDSFPDVLKGIDIREEYEGVEIQGESNSSLLNEKLKLGQQSTQPPLLNQDVVDVNPETGEVLAEQQKYPTFEEVSVALQKANTVQALTDAADLIRSIPQLEPGKLSELRSLYKEKQASIKS